MNETIKYFLTQSKGVKIFFYVTGGAFTALTLYAFYLNIVAINNVQQAATGTTVSDIQKALAGIPADLKQMTLAAWGIIAMGIKEGLGKVESMTNIDIDGNGVVGTVTNFDKLNVEPKAEIVAATPTAPEAAAPVPATEKPKYGP